MLELKTSNSIIIPEGKMAAPNDYRIIHQRLVMPSGQIAELDLIKQTRQGNCSEYTSINSLLLLQSAGLSVARLSTINPDTIEPKLIRLISEGLDVVKGLVLRGEDYECLSQKIDDPYITLTGNDTAVIFRMLVAPQRNLDFTGDVFVDPTDCAKKALIQSNTAILIGSGVHATSIIKLGTSCYEVDPFFPAQPITPFHRSELSGKIKSKLQIPGSFAVINQL